jgi:hypothetical protein
MGQSWSRIPRFLITEIGRASTSFLYTGAHKILFIESQDRKQLLFTSVGVHPRPRVHNPLDIVHFLHHRLDRPILQVYTKFKVCFRCRNFYRAFKTFGF